LCCRDTPDLGLQVLYLLVGLLLVFLPVLQAGPDPGLRPGDLGAQLPVLVAVNLPVAREVVAVLPLTLLASATSLRFHGDLLALGGFTTSLRFHDFDLLRHIYYIATYFGAFQQRF
jgi:hypothetical protein